MDHQYEPSSRKKRVGVGADLNADEQTPLNSSGFPSPEDELCLLQDVRGRRSRVNKASSDENAITTPVHKNYAKHYYGPNDNKNKNSNGAPSQPEEREGGRNGKVSGGSAKKRNCNSIITILVSIAALGLCLGALSFDAASSWWNGRTERRSKETNGSFDDFGRYVMEDYDTQTPFSDFLPGLAGIYGKPLYAYFVNRGQAIATFGIESKNYPILEFQPANKAYQLTPLVGFRTFIQGSRRKENFLLEPFSPLRTNYPNAPTMTSTIGGPPERLPKRTMYNGENELQLHEMDYENNLETNVTYFVLPEEDFGAFVRRTTITNTDSQEPVTLSVLDGLARMEPAGGKLESYLKDKGQTLESFMGVHFPYDDSITMPFYRLTTQPTDSAKVHMQDRGHYCLSFFEGTSNSPQNQVPSRLLPVVYDPSKVFGEDTSLLRPVQLFSKSIDDIVKSPQYGKAKTPSCFGAVETITLEPGETVIISTFYGAADRILDLPVIARRIMQEGFVLYKLTRTREVIRQITKTVATRTSHRLFDEHIQQMFLDNSLRGGIPLLLGDDEDDGISNADEDPRVKVFHVFSRIHGDLERDYNDFMLSPSFFSEGPGNFRDVIQNRREDVVFNPRIGSFNVRMFLSFIQADGYEPDSIEAGVFRIEDVEVCSWVAERAVGRADGHRAQREALIGILNGGSFRPGQLFGLLEQQNIELIISRQQFIDMVASVSDFSPMAVFKEGFWADHFTYYLDMIKSYLSIYPDGEYRLLYETELPYFFSPASVQPRSKKYVLSLKMYGYGYHVQQLDATVEDPVKLKYMDSFRSDTTGWYDTRACWQNAANGQPFQSSIAAKLVLLATLKFATRDAFGMGIEYEGGKPGWDDANNGLAAMLGSGMPETFELKVLLQYLSEATNRYRRAVIIPIELSDLIEEIQKSLDELGEYPEPSTWTDEVPMELFNYWDRVATAREEYREQIRVTFSGNTTEILARDLSAMLHRWQDEVDRGIGRAIFFGTTGASDNNTIPTYFAYEVTKYKRTGDLNSEGHPYVTPRQLGLGRFPAFLEGPTRLMKTVRTTQDASAIYRYVREESGLRDHDLSMYTVSANLHGQSIDMGRTMAFPPGWAENQGVWMHMSYKFYLELLRQHLYEEFFDEATSGGLLPFMDSRKYGRSVTECSSFIASSAFEDPSKHGRGFLARLSGSTSEFLSMWVLMFVGPKPFFVDPDDYQLRMQLVPSLPAWIFESREGDNLENDEELRDDPLLRLAQEQHPNTLTVRFKLFSSIQVHYYNLRRTDLFGIVPTRYRIGLRDGTVFEVEGSVIGVDLADKIRRVVFVDFIEAYF